MRDFCHFYRILPLSFLLLFLLPAHNGSAQNAAAAAGGSHPSAAPTSDERIGVYRAKFDPALELRISRNGDQLLVQILGQGRTVLAPQSGGRYALKGVRPAARMEFLKNDSGRIDGCRVFQKEPLYTWERVDGGDGPLAGTYRMAINPYHVFHIRAKDGRLIGQTGNSAETPLTPLGRGRYEFVREGNKYQLEFKTVAGKAVSMVARGSYPYLLTKISSVLPHVSNRTNGFTHADTVQGMLTPLRTCYDVLFYGLSITVLPETRSIRGSNLIRWRTVHSFRRMQVDLYENLAVDTIDYHGRPLHFTREGNAVYIDLPAELPEGSVDQLRIYYSGIPLQPDIDALKGGIFWLTNRDKRIWIESVTQGIGASVYWPCKDHLSDRPDSMSISITVPHGLMDISNGRLLGRTELSDGQTRFDWYVDYPIVTYNVVMNIGDYTHFSDSYVREGGDTLALKFYCMSYNLDSARKLFADAKRMIALYEKLFGPYPCPRDGFTALESIYPMDHQGAVSIGSMRSPFNGDKYDGDVRRTLWHESAHEWWGNSVGCSDYADMWIHEAFATYAEYLNEESLRGRAAALKDLTRDHPENKEPIIGVYNVNHFHMGDMYLKGALMLETLRSVIGDDSLWFSIFRGIQQRFRQTPVSSKEIEAYFNTATGKDYSWFFDEYLRYPHIPVLVLSVQQEGDGLRVSYKWEADVPGFRMPVKVTLSKGGFAFIYPTTTPQTMEIKGMGPKDFAVDREDFYIDVRGL
jgi:hypothetical protein